jgi:hypothetical protein
LALIFPTLQTRTFWQSIHLSSFDAAILKA